MTTCELDNIDDAYYNRFYNYDLYHYDGISLFGDDRFPSIGKSLLGPDRRRTRRHSIIHKRYSVYTKSVTGTTKPVILEFIKNLH